jgi:ABC-type Fe3+ transport system permease subunit
MSFFVAVQNQAPMIVTLVDKATPQADYGDVIVGSLGLAAVLAIGAMLLGGVMAFFLVHWNRRHRPEQDHMPQITN